MFPEEWHISIRRHVNSFVDFLVIDYGYIFKGISWFVLQIIIKFDYILLSIPWWAYIVFLSLSYYFIYKNVIQSILIGILIFSIGLLGLWGLMLQTLSLVLVSLLGSILIGLPLGILMARSEIVKRIGLPVLDAMQTMPSFVYLIPVLMLFGLGKVSAVFATILYSVPPLARLTDLGIRQVDTEIVEAAKAFGANRSQLLLGVQLPLATPSIMAGLNQTVMMALSMVVIASMIGARGLGEQVLSGIQSLDVGKGLEAGIAVVILAIVLDRLVQGLARRKV